MIRPQEKQYIKDVIKFIDDYTERKWLSISTRDLTIKLLAVIDFTDSTHMLTPNERNYLRGYAKDRIAKWEKM